MSAFGYVDLWVARALLAAVVLTLILGAWSLLLYWLGRCAARSFWMASNAAGYRAWRNNGSPKFQLDGDCYRMWPASEKPTGIRTGKRPPIS